MARERIKAYCVSSLDATKIVISKETQESIKVGDLEREHEKFAERYAKIQEHINKAGRVQTYTGIAKYNPKKHKFAYMGTLRTRIRGAEDYYMFVKFQKEITISDK